MCPLRADKHRQLGDSKSPPDGKKPGEHGAAPRAAQGQARGSSRPPGPRGSAGRGWLPAARPQGACLGKKFIGLLCLQRISETHVVWKPVSPPTCDLPVPVTMSGEAPHGPARGIQAPPSAPQGRAGLTTWQILVQKKTVP